jgi:DNA-binding CsgD family transcriptional regulator
MERVVAGPTPLQTVIVRGASVASTPLILDVMPMPSLLLGFTSGPRVVVVARGARGIHARKAALLRAAYGLTPAETEIALLLAQAKSAEAIAQERQVAVCTVRDQIKSVLAKLGVSRQVELVLKISEL